MRTPNILSFTPVLTMIAALGLPLVAQDSDPLRETVKRLETALAQIESRLQTMQATTGAAQGSALDQVQREQEALRAQLATRDAEFVKLRANLEAQAATAQRVADERASQVAALETKLQHASQIAAQDRDRLAEAREQMNAMAQQANALNAALGERDRRLAQQEENAARSAALANERGQQTLGLRRELDALRGQLTETQATAELERRAAATRLEAALTDLDAALHRPPPATESGVTTVKTDAGSVQVHHHGPGDIILNFHGAPTTTSVPPKPRIEI